VTTDLRTALRTLAEAAPVGAAVTVTLPRAALLALVQGDGTRPQLDPDLGRAAVGWRAMLWTVPEDTRMRVADVAEALGRPRSFVYRAVAAKQGEHRLPAARLHGELSFTAGTVRAWLQREEAHV
jgi:hypothetical protein